VETQPTLAGRPFTVEKNVVVSADVTGQPRALPPLVTCGSRPPQPPLHRYSSLTPAFSKNAILPAQERVLS
jgi:hypothetical protein